MKSTFFFGLTVCLLAAVNICGALSARFDYEYGTKGIGVQVWRTSGHITIFQYHTVVHIPVPYGMRITYLKASVWAATAPDVKIDVIADEVTIDYSIVQIPVSDYEIYAEFGYAYGSPQNDHAAQLLPGNARQQ